MKKELELYLHIPFCVQKCAYCDFLSAPAGEALRAEYTEALKEEIEGYRGLAGAYRVSTIFMGGGTPSILSCRQIEEIFTVLRSVFTIDKDAEISIEANPGTVTEEKLEAWKQAGINRISFGLQSVNDKELKMLGRIHTYEEFLVSYQMARNAGFQNINVDLISAIPGQTTNSWIKTLKTVAELKPEHISAYSLIVEEGTKFYDWYGEDRSNPDNLVHPPLPDEDSERFMYEETERILAQYGFHRYEISNYAKEGYACRHNLGYWQRKEYLGIGLGASSLIQNKRYHLVREISSYIEGVNSKSDIREEIENLSKEEQMEEYMFLGLRVMEGISKQKFKEEFQEEIEAVYGIQIRKLVRDGLLEESGDRIRLTHRGIDISNYVFETFLF